jgi:hypothetical protein
MGMNHEQNRPDAPGQGLSAGGWKGPYLWVNWDQIDHAWVPQWQGKKRSYTGSKTAGYADYDYESIMHYGLDDKAEPVHPEWGGVPGQREGLSTSDVRQISDMYQCAAGGGADHSGAGHSSSNYYYDDGCLDEPGMHWQQYCSQWAEQGYCSNTEVYNKCQGSCDEAHMVVHDHTCLNWRVWGYCESSETIQYECFHLCDFCP